MAVYSIGRRTSAVTSGQAALDVVAGGGVRARLMEMAVFMAAVTASTYGLFKSTAVGTRTTPVALLAEDPADTASECDSALVWSVQPTLAGEAYRRISLPATVGTGVIWTFPRGLVVVQALGLVLQNLASNGVVDAHLVVDE